MVAEIVGVGSIMSVGTAAFLFLNSRINRSEDKSDEHFQCLDQKVSNMNREVGEIKTIVERIEKNGRK